MEYRVTVQKADHDAYVKFVQKSLSTGFTASFWKSFAVWMVVGLVAATSANLLGLRTHRLHTPTALLTAGALAALLLFYAAQARKRMSPDPQGFVLGDRTYVVDDDGFRDVRPNFESLTRWQAVVKLGETKEQVFLMLDNVAGHIVPTRTLSASENAALRAFLKDKVPVLHQGG